MLTNVNRGKGEGQRHGNISRGYQGQDRKNEPLNEIIMQPSGRRFLNPPLAFQNFKGKFVSLAILGVIFVL